MKKIAIVIPTYNEVENIELLIKEIIAEVPECEIYIIDDSSLDGTGNLINKLKRKDKRIHLIEREKKGGRGSAVIEGFRWALKDKEIQYFVEMDADFSHRPKELRKLLEKARSVDIVIGSRYLPKSKIVGWPLTRKVFSKLANFYAKLMLGVPITDYTNGFRCYQRKVLEREDLKKIKSTGYIVLSETAYVFYKAGFSFDEIPTIFVNRKRGKSNTNFKEILNAYYGINAIRSHYAK